MSPQIGLPTIKEDEKAVRTVGWDEDDPLHPHRLPSVKKWVIVLLLCIATICMGFTSSLYASGQDQLIQQMALSREVATLGLSLFIGGLGLGPMFLAPLSEFFGRKPIYLASLILFMVWLVPCAVAKNPATLLVARFLDGVSGSALTSVAGGTVGDLFSREELITPLMFFTASPLSVVLVWITRHQDD